MSTKILTHTLPATLSQARKALRLSQLELAMKLDVSQRHISFVESGRAKPSRDLFLAWLRVLNTPMAVSNAALLQAGFAPAFSEAKLGDPQLAPAQDALAALLQAHDPMPAMVLDAQWNVLQMNRGAQWLSQHLIPELFAAMLANHNTPMNMLDVLCHPQGFASKLVNFADIGPKLLAQLRDDATVIPELRPRVEHFANYLKLRLGPDALQQAWQNYASPLLTSVLRSPFGDLSFFSMFTTFGRPQDITLA